MRKLEISQRINQQVGTSEREADASYPISEPCCTCSGRIRDSGIRRLYDRAAI